MRRKMPMGFDMCCTGIVWDRSRRKRSRSWPVGKGKFILCFCDRGILIGDRLDVSVFVLASAVSSKECGPGFLIQERKKKKKRGSRSIERNRSKGNAKMIMYADARCTLTPEQMENVLLRCNGLEEGVIGSGRHAIDETGTPERCQNAMPMWKISTRPYVVLVLCRIPALGKMSTQPLGRMSYLSSSSSRLR